MPIHAFILLLCLVMAAPPRATANDGTLVFGIYPYLSPNQIAQQFKPLSDHLAAKLGRPVQMVSAPGFAEFVRRTQAGEYDIIFTSPHMGRLAQTRDGYQPAAQTGWRIEIVVLARKDGPVKSLADLKGRSLASGARLSMTYQIIDQALGRHGMALGREVRFIDTASFSNVPDAVMRGEADAGATGTILWERTPADQRDALQVIHQSEPVPGFLVMSHKRLGAQLHAALEQALFGFRNTPGSKAYFESTGQIDFRPVDEATLKRIDPYTAVFKSR
jgi:phosphonate transport system substrate-binding protein